MFDVTPSPSPSESSSASSPVHSQNGSFHTSQDELDHSSPIESPHSSENESYHTSPDESPHSSDYESSYSSPSPHLSIRSPILGSAPNSSSSSAGPSPTRFAFPFPTHLPMHPELKPMRSCMPNAIPPGPNYLPRVRFISYLLASRPLPRRPPPSASPKEASNSQPPEVSIKGLIATPPRSITSTLSSLSLLSLTPPPSPSRAAFTRLPASQSPQPSTSLTLTSDALSRLSSKPTHCKSLPMLNAPSYFPPILPSTSSLQQATMPLAPYESLKKSVSEPNLQN